MCPSGLEHLWAATSAVTHARGPRAWCCRGGQLALAPSSCAQGCSWPVSIVSSRRVHSPHAAPRAHSMVQHMGPACPPGVPSELMWMVNEGGSATGGLVSTSNAGAQGMRRWEGAWPAGIPEAQAKIRNEPVGLHQTTELSPSKGSHEQSAEAACMVGNSPDCASGKDSTQNMPGPRSTR